MSTSTDVVIVPVVARVANVLAFVREWSSIAITFTRSS